MAVTATPIFPQAFKNAVQTIAPADTSTVKTLITAGTNGTKVQAILATSTDTSARDLALYLTISATNYLLGTVAIPLTSGSVNSVVTVDVLHAAQIPGLPFDGNGNHVLFLAPGSSLSIATLTTVTAAKLVTVVAQGADF